MRMTRRLAITIAVLCGLLAALLTYVYLSSLQRQPEKPVVLPVQVIVPVETINKDALLTTQMVETRIVPQGQAPADAVRDLNTIQGNIALEELPAGQPIIRKQISEHNGPLGLAYVVPPGMRAVTVALDPIIGVAGFLKPGDRVDVVVTFKIADKVITRTVLQNVQLLALGETTILSRERGVGEEEGAEPKAETQPNATLSVTPKDAQRLIISDGQGTIRLALRRRGETEYQALQPTDLFSITGIEFKREEVEKEQPPSELAQPVPTEGLLAPAGPPKPTVEVIRGGQREIVTP